MGTMVPTTPAVALALLLVLLFSGEATEASGLSGLWQKLRGTLAGHRRADNCGGASVAVGACAVLFHHSGCNGWNEPLSEGYHALPRRRKNEAESVLVAKGCKLVGKNFAQGAPRLNFSESIET